MKTPFERLSSVFYFVAVFFLYAVFVAFSACNTDADEPTIDSKSLSGSVSHPRQIEHAVGGRRRSTVPITTKPPLPVLKPDGFPLKLGEKILPPKEPFEKSDVLVKFDRPYVRGAMSSNKLYKLVMQKKNKLVACYIRGLELSPALIGGNVKYKMVAVETGNHLVMVRESTLGYPNIEACVANVIKTLRIPIPKDRGISALMSFDFQVKNIRTNPNRRQSAVGVVR